MNSSAKTDPGKEEPVQTLEETAVGLTFEHATELHFAAIVKEQSAQHRQLSQINQGLKSLGTLIVHSYEKKIKKLEKRVSVLERKNGR